MTKLTELLDTIQEKRKYVSDTDLKSVSIVCFLQEIEQAVKCFKEQYPSIQIEKICIFNATQDTTVKEYENIPVENLDSNLDKENLAVFAQFEDDRNACWKNIMDYINCKTKNIFYYYSDKFYKNGTALYTPAIQHFYKVHKFDIDRAFNLLSSNQSKKVFAQRLKSIMYGRSGFLEFNGEPEYFPSEPKDFVCEGDVIIDVGISCYHPELLEYSRLTGEKGKVIAFEASPVEYKKILDTFDKQKYSNVEIENLGLWDSNTTLNISDNIGGSSVVYDFLNRNIECKLVKLDDYVENNKLPKVDYIKMDIEGAEPNALKGAIKTLKKFRPKLAICIYHEPMHLFSIIKFLNELNLGYKFYICHHSAYLPETVMYAEPIPDYQLTIKSIITNITKPVFDIFRQTLVFIKDLKNKFLINSCCSKRLIIYAAGTIYDELKHKNYFKNSNVIAISDIKFTQESTLDGYKAIPPDKIAQYNPDCIYIAMKYPEIAHSYLSDILKDKYKHIRFVNYITESKYI